MSDSMINLAGLGDWTPYEGLGKSDLFPADGTFSFTVEKSVPGMTKDKTREVINLSLAINDPDAKGLHSVHTLVVGGNDKNGKPMIRQLGDLLASTGLTQDQIRSLSAQGQAPLAAIAQKLIGKVGYGRFRAETYDANDGRGPVPSSKVENFITEAAYKEAAQTGSHRRMHNFGTGATGAAAPAAGGIQSAPVTNGVTKAPAVPAPPAFNF